MNKEQEKTNIVKQILNDNAKFDFRPNKAFYALINVKFKRWAMFVRGEKEPTITELQSICAYFKTDLVKYLQPAQA
jgi:hypothetical protein